MDVLPPTLAAFGSLGPEHLIETFGTLGVVIIVFAESCVAFFLPGDSLLAVAGFLASEGRMNLPVVIGGVILAAIAGNQVGYAIGRRIGVGLFSRPNSRFFRQEHLEKTHAYFEKNGPKTIVIARFVPIVRTFACIVAGAARMEYRVFVIYNVIGAVLWGAGVTLIGYGLGKWLGKSIDIDKYLLPFILVIVALSFIPFFIEMYKARKHNNQTPVGEVVEELAEEISDQTKK